MERSKKMLRLRDGGVEGRTALGYSKKEGLYGNDELMLELFKISVTPGTIEGYEKAGFEGKYKSMINLMINGADSLKAQELAPWFEGNEQAMLTIQDMEIPTSFIQSQIVLMDGTKPESQNELLTRLVDLYNFGAKPTASSGK